MRPLPSQQVGHGGVDRAAAGVGELHQHAALVLRVAAAADQARRRQPVDPVGHRAGRDQGRAQQRAGAELVGRPCPAQRGQHVELPRLQAVRRERGPAHPVQVPGQPGDAAEHMQRRDVQVRPFGSPARDDLVDLVPDWPGRGCHERSISLDIKTSAAVDSDEIS